MSNRYRDEIEEILKQSTESQPRMESTDVGSEVHPMQRSKASNVAIALGRKLSPAKLMLASLSLLLIALVMNALTPAFVGPIAWTGIVLFIIAYASFFVLPRKTKVERRWRGRSVDYERTPWWNFMFPRGKP